MTRLMNEIIIKKECTILDTRDLNNIHDVLIVREEIIDNLNDLVKHLTKKTFHNRDIFKDVNFNEYILFIEQNYLYNNKQSIEDVYIDEEVVNELLEYIKDYFE